MTIEGNKAVDLLWVLRPVLYGLCIERYGKPDTWTAKDKRSALVATYKAVADYTRGKTEQPPALISLAEAHKLFSCVEDCRVLYTGKNTNRIYTKLLSDLRDVFMCKFYCPECGELWDAEHNRCSANAKHCT